MTCPDCGRSIPWFEQHQFAICRPCARERYKMWHEVMYFGRLARGWVLGDPIYQSAPINQAPKDAA